MTASSPLAANTDLVTYSLKIDGQPMGDSVRVLQIYVHKEVNQIADARITLLDGDPDAGFAVSESAEMTPGRAITISAGYHGIETVLFEGIIDKHALRVRRDGSPARVLTCFDKAVKLTQGRKSASLGRTDSDILQALIAGAGLDGSVEPTSAMHDSVVRYRATDWDFIVGRARANGKIVLVDDGRVTVCAPACSGSPSLRIGYGDALQEIDAEIDVRTQAPSGTVSFRGSAIPKPGGLVELDGLGERFNGAAFVSSVVHTLEEGDWITEVGFGLDPRWFMEEDPAVASNLLPGVQGLLNGVVRKIDDPDGQVRVQVDVPMIGLDGVGIWARLAAGYATDNAGIFFVPEVGDEVILGFLNGDPGHPVVLGSLYSGERAPPYQPDATNTNKAIITKAQLKISMDDVKKCLQIETPGGHMVTMNDEDNSVTIKCSNGNMLHFEGAGITLESAADITIKAGGNLNLEATAAMSANAGTKMEMEAPQITANASMRLSMQGQATAEMTSLGQTTVRGSIVMIN